MLIILIYSFLLLNLNKLYFTSVRRLEDDLKSLGKVRSCQVTDEGAFGSQLHGKRREEKQVHRKILVEKFLLLVKVEKKILSNIIDQFKNSILLVRY